LHEDILFGYFEYVGDDFEADMADIAQDPETLWGARTVSVAVNWAFRRPARIR
jgi:L-rhamnose mutarotase